MENNEMPHIKSFIYLDEDKMYSASSQLFRGITQYILQDSIEGTSEEEQQKGKFLSGRFFADMMFQARGKSELRHLHDFAFNLFEKELEDRGMLYDIKPTDHIEDLLEKGFVRIRGKIFFCDYSRMQYIVENFNTVGRAFGGLNSVVGQIEELKETAKQTKDREQRNKQRNAAKVIEKKLDDILRQQGLLLDDKYIDNLSTIIKFGFQDKFEVQIVLPNSCLNFSAVANPLNFKEKADVLVSKYSRITEKEFTIVGIVTQVGNPKPEIPALQGIGMKTAAQGIHEKIANLEVQFNGRSENECIIDPIAIFTEL